MSRLEQVTCVCMISVSILAGSVIVERWSSGFSSNREPSTQALVGKKIGLRGLQWNEVPLHLVVALNSHCSFCEASLPLYRKLGEVSKRVGSRISLTVVSPEPEEVTRRFLSEHGVPSSRVVSVPLRELGVRGTPTMLLVDSSGTVLRVFSGKLAPANEAVVMKAATSGFSPGT